jgi:hypothetical protein
LNIFRIKIRFGIENKIWSQNKSSEFQPAMLGYTFISQGDLHAKEEEMRHTKMEVVEAFLQLQS